MAEKRPAETSTEEPVPKKRGATNISNDSDNTEKNDAPRTTKTSSVTRDPQIKNEVTPNYFQNGKKYVCIHCTNVLATVTLSTDCHTFQCARCNKLIHFNDYYQKKDMIHEKLIQNIEFSWSRLNEINQLNIEKSKKNLENFNKMKEYISLIDKLKDEIREFEEALYDCENRYNEKVDLFLKRKIRDLEDKITSIKKEVETLSVS